MIRRSERAERANERRIPMEFRHPSPVFPASADQVKFMACTPTLVGSGASWRRFKLWRRRARRRGDWELENLDWFQCSSPWNRPKSLAELGRERERAEEREARGELEPASGGSSTLRLRLRLPELSASAHHLIIIIAIIKVGASSGSGGRQPSQPVSQAAAVEEV